MTATYLQHANQADLGGLMDELDVSRDCQSLRELHTAIQHLEELK